MNFDDLRDPHPPHAGPAALAAVTARARQLRRRRTGMTTAAGTLTAAAVMVPITLVAIGGEPADRVVPATSPVTTAPPAVTAQAVPTSTPARTTEPSPPPRPTIAAVDGNGDAVVVAPDGTATILADGPDLDDAAPTGDPSGYDTLTISPDLGRAWVTSCCEPVPGTWAEIAPASGQVIAEGYGHGFDLDATGDRLVAVTHESVEVRTLDGTPVASTSFENVADACCDPYEVAWVDGDTIAVLELAGPGFRLLTTTPSFDGYETSPRATLDGDLDSPWPTLAGTTPNGDVLVLVPGTSVLQAYDPVTLERSPSADITVPGAASHAWADGHGLIWIDGQRTLHVGDEIQPGEYLWARPV